MGGCINGRRILGDQVQVANLFQNRDYPVLTDYRSMFAGLFQAWKPRACSGSSPVFIRQTWVGYGRGFVKTRLNLIFRAQLTGIALEL